MSLVTILELLKPRFQNLSPKLEFWILYSNQDFRNSKVNETEFVSIQIPVSI